MSHLYQILEPRRLSEDFERDEFAGAGAPPPYLLAEEVKVLELKAAIHVDISSIRASINSTNAQMIENNSSVNLAEENSNYIANQPVDEPGYAIESEVPPKSKPMTTPELPSDAGIQTYNAPTSSNSTTEANDDNYNLEATYNVEINGNTGETVVTDPDGTKHTFDSQADAQAYIDAEAKKHDGCIIVNYTETTTTTHHTGGRGNMHEVSETNVETWSYVYDDGVKVKTFTPDNDSTLSSAEQANQWLHNQYYENADMSYVYDYSHCEGLDENSSTADVLQAAEEDLDDAFDNYDSDQFYYYNDDGMMLLDVDRLTAWYDKVRLLCAILVFYQMIMEAEQESRDSVLEELLDLPAGGGLDTGTIVANKISNRLKMVSVAFGDLMEQMMDYNQAQYDADVEVANAQTSGFGNTTSDMLTGGGQTITGLEMQQDAVERYLRAMRTVLDLLNRTVNSDKPMEYDPNDPNSVYRALQDRETVSFSKLPSIVYSGDNDYWELDEEKLSSVRKGFYGLQSVRNIINTVHDAESEAKNLIHKEMTGVGGRSRSNLDNKLLEMDNQYKTMLFETNIRLTQQKMQLENNVRFLEGEILKARTQRVYNVISNIFALAGLVCAFIPGVGTAVTLLLGLAAAGIKLAGAIHANQIAEDYAYEPDTPLYEEENYDTDTGNPSVDAMNGAANMEEEIIGQDNGNLIQDEDTDEGRVGSWWRQSGINPGNWFTDRASETFKVVNYAEIARLQLELVKIQNLRRIIVSLHKEKASLRNLVHMEMTGVGGYQTPSYLLDSALGNEFRLSQFKLETFTFMLNEYKTAENMSIAKDKSLASAVNGFILSVAMEIGCAALGGFLGDLFDKGKNVAQGAADAGSEVATEAARTLSERLFYVGWGVGGAVGGFLSTLLYEFTMGSFLSSYGDDGVPAYIRAFRRNNPNTTEARLGRLEAEIYEDLLTNGINKNVGDGYWAMDGGYVARLRMALARIANLKNILITLTEATSEARNLVHLEMTGVSGRRSGGLAREVAEAEFQGFMKVFDDLVQLLGQRIEVQRRHIDSKKQITDAAWKLGIDLALVAATVGAGITISQGAFSFMSPLMGIFNAVYDLIINMIRGKRGEEYVNNYNAELLANELKNEDSPDSTWSKIDEMEMQVYSDISTDLIEDVGAGRWGINSGSISILRHRMEKIYNLKDVIASLKSAKAEMRATIHSIMSGAGGRVGNVRGLFSSQQMAAMANIGTLYQNVLSVVDVHNQMNAAKRATLQSLVAVTVSVANLVLVYKSTVVREKYQDNVESGKIGEKVLADKKVLAESQKNAAIEAYSKGDAKLYDESINNYRKTAADSENIKSNLMSKQSEREELIEQYQQFALYQFIGGLAENCAVLLAGLIYDSGFASNGARKSVKKAREERMERRAEYIDEIRNGSKNTQKGWVTGVTKSEASSLESAVNSGTSELDMTASELTEQQNEQVLKNIWNSVKSSAEYVAESVKQKTPHTFLSRKDPKNNIPHPVAPPPVPPKESSTTGEVIQSKENNSPNTRVLIERMDQVIQKMGEFLQKVGEGYLPQLEQKMLNAKEDLNVLASEGQKPAELAAQLEVAKSLLQEAMDAWSKAVKKHMEAHDKLSELKNTTLVKEEDIKKAQELIREAKTMVDEARVKVKEAAKVVNKIIVTIERAKKDGVQKGAKKSTSDTLTESAVLKVDNNLKDKNRRQKNLYEMYKQERDEEMVVMQKIESKAGSMMGGGIA